MAVRHVTITLFAFALFGVFFRDRVRADIWKKDVTSEMKIGLSESGYRRVDLKCKAESFSVNVTLESDFEGVVYTRGSFSNRTSACFKTREDGLLLEDSMLMSLEIPFDECRTGLSESRHVNTLIVQHDPDFIMPGDAAFALHCHVTPEFEMTTNIVADSPYRSGIVLVDADPSATDSGDSEHAAKGSGDTVSFLPRGTKDEL